MNITATVHQGRITPPDELGIADGTEVQVILPKPAAPLATASVTLPSFKGDGLQPGVDLEDRAQVRGLLDEEFYADDPH
jgi:hypothetical protein